MVTSSPGLISTSAGAKQRIKTLFDKYQTGTPGCAQYLINRYLFFISFCFSRSKNETVPYRTRRQEQATGARFPAVALRARGPLSRTKNRYKLPTHFSGLNQKIPDLTVYS